MKLLLGSTLLVILPYLTLSAVSYTNDFVSGFESGVFIRNAEDLEQYGCPEANGGDILGGQFGSMKEMLAPLKMMGAFV